ncbi:MAG: excinuclease ABC subunit UvrC [Chloroflexota bacterium]|nr:MAG: excinuclease ABC subunit UvrC [Chloroflexota bacterium]
MEISDHLQSILDSAPTKTGCYLMKDVKGKVIYVGKAINLRNRLRSYYHASAMQNLKSRQMVRRIADIDWILVGSELEALILEMNLIKKYRPHFNVRLKDDKRYPYIKVHWQNPFPKLTVTRQMVNDGSRYFGPYTSVWAVHQTLDVLRRIFPYLTCDREITGEDKRACLYYDIKLCTAPCIGVINQDNYRQVIDDLCQFLSGRTEPILSRLQEEMEAAANQLQFERAAALRDQINAIQKVVERQKVVSTEYIDSDVIAMARSNGEACVQVFFIRGGKLMGREYFLLQGAEGAADADVISGFIKQFYDQASMVPSQVLLPHEIEEAHIIKQWLSSRRPGETFEILIPHEGQQRELIQLAAENAAETLNALQARWQAEKHRQTEALAELQSALNLPIPPNRIECYDISNTQGTSAVGSMVVFEMGIPSKKLYRRFNIRSVTGPDDFASMEEVLLRRFNRWQAAQELGDQPGEKVDQSFALLPDLLIVDGGKGQLGRAVGVLAKYNLVEKIPVVGLAKQHEEIFVPGQPGPILLPQNTQGLFLLQRVRDEAHRFAITSHRKQHTKTGLASRLDAIPGVGPARRKALLGKFGSIQGILDASVEEISSLPGISESLAHSIKIQLE